MATTGELRDIIAQLQLIDIGDAASYLGEEDFMEEAPVMEQPVEPADSLENGENCCIAFLAGR